MDRRPTTTRKTPQASALVTLALAMATLLAGCLGDEELDMEAFRSALDAPGETHTPDSMAGGAELRVKLLVPVDPTRAGRDHQPLALLVYDAARELPIGDAQIGLTSRMPDHGTEDETDPVHVGGGVYEGETHHFMDGTWEVHLAGVRPNGDFFELRIPFIVAG